MKLHLPLFLFHAIRSGVAVVLSAFAYVMADESASYTNGSITFNKQQTGSCIFMEYEKLDYTGSSSSYQGGAIYVGNNVSCSFSGNGQVYLASNSSEYGGAIYNAGSVTMRKNENITFSFNRALGNPSYQYSGGAISNGAYFILSENGIVSFTNNSSDTGGAIINGYSFIMNDNSQVSFSSNSGGAIYNGETFTMEGNENVTFSGNSGGRYSGSSAINNWGLFTLSGSKNVTFSANLTSCSYLQTGYGGAIYNKRTFFLSNNESINFTGNTNKGKETSQTLSDVSASGGAINNVGEFTIEGNKEVRFNENTVSPEAYHVEYRANNWSRSTAKAYGGAISNKGSFVLRRASLVDFSANQAFASARADSAHPISQDCASSYSYGGAIYNVEENASFLLEENDTVCFSENIAKSESSSKTGCSGKGYAYGGAIYNSGTLGIRNNGSVIFSGNSAVTGAYESASVYGGAIYNEGCLEISGNSDVLFERNSEIIGRSYRLRSIYSNGTIKLAAKEGNNITFRDSVYANGSILLNEDGTGNIVFSGATIKADLKAVKNGVEGTANEILNSRTSEFAANAKLYGGALGGGG